MERAAEPRLPQEFTLDAFADRSSVRDVVRGILHTIFFHRYFPTIAPQTHEVLDLTLPYVAEPELETLIDQRTSLLVRELSSPSDNNNNSYPAFGGGAAGAIGAMLGVTSGGGGGGGTGGGDGRGRVTVQFLDRIKAERKGRRIGMWGGGGGGKAAEDEVCWESWTLRVTVAEPRTDSERAKVRQATASTLHTTIMKIITSVNTHKDHIPLITMQEGANPFPYNITVNQRNGSEVAAGGVGGAMTRGFRAIF